MSNLGLFRALDDLGIASAKTAVGDKYVYEYMTKNNCRLGGEQSGHIIFSKYASTGDGILTSLKVMEVMCAAKKTLHQLASDLTIYPQKLINVRVKDKKAAQADAKVQEAIRAAEEKLGYPVFVKPAKAGRHGARAGARERHGAAGARDGGSAGRGAVRTVLRGDCADHPGAGVGFVTEGVQRAIADFACFHALWR